MRNKNCCRNRKRTSKTPSDSQGGDNNAPLLELLRLLADDSSQPVLATRPLSKEEEQQ